MYYIYRFVYVETSMHPWDEADLVMENDLSDMLLDSVCHYFIEVFFLFFYSFIHRCIYCLVISSPCPPPPASPAFSPQFQAGPVLSLSLVC
jgi:hypothetical protein